MPLPEYIPSDLPQYASSVDRTSFNSAVVQSGDALLFIESGKLIAKKDDGNFYELGAGEGSGGFDFSDVTADPEDVLEDEVFYDSNGDLQFGTMRAEYDIEPIMPSTSSQVVSGDCYLGTDLIISGDSNLVASNIRSGVTIFEVAGAYEGSSTDFSSTTAVPGGVLSGGVFYDSTGALTTGTIPTVTASIVDNNVVVPAGYIATSQTFPISSGVDAVAGYYVNNSGTLTFQPLSSGASAEAVSALQIVNTGVPEPDYASGGGGSTMNFYKCASVTPASSETFYVMSGAGESGCNGTWSATTSSSQDQPIYQNEYGATMVYQGYDTWEIDAPSGNTVWYIGEGSADVMQITNWIVAAGMSPAPSITESSTSTAATWAGYLASVDSSTGIWNFASAATSGLAYDRLTPVVGNVYDESCTFQVTRYRTGIPSSGLVFYASLNGDTPSMAETGQSINTSGTVTYTTANGIACASLSSSSYLYGSSTVGLPTGQNARAISAWFKLNSHNQSDGSDIFCYGTNSNNQRYIIGVQANQIFVAAYNNTAVIQASVSLNTWYHIVVYYTEATEFIYINGTLLGSVSHNNLNTGSAGWCVGAEWGEFSYGRLDGYVAALRVYNRVLTSDEISALAAEFTPTAS